MRLFATFAIFFSSIVFGGLTQEERLVDEVQNHLLIGDIAAALEKIESALKINSDSKQLQKAYIQTLAKSFDEKKLFSNYLNYIKKYPEEKKDRHLLEEICWSILDHATDSKQYTIRLASLLGAYKSHDAKAVGSFLKSLEDTNAVIRLIAVQLACHYSDLPLKKKVTNLYEKEKLWLVKVELIRALGKMRLKDKTSELKKIIASDRISIEEKQAATEALLDFCDTIEPSEVKHLAQSTRTGLRSLACEIAAHMKMKEVAEEILKLTQDPITDVRAGALKAIGVFFHKVLPKEKLIQTLKTSLEDTNPVVSVTACWLAMNFDQKAAEKTFRKWLESDYCENRWLAAAALSRTGKKGVNLSLELIKKSKDPYLLANLSLGLIGQRTKVKKCCDILYNLLQKEKRRWMIETYPNTFFSVLCPSKVRHIDQIPNYPEAVDQMTRLTILSLLAILEDSRAESAIRSFLKTKNWGITGFAAATLLQEGDEESLKVVRDLLKDEDSNVRLQAALVLALYGKERSAVPVLQDEYSKADYMTKLQIIEALGFVGDSSNYDFFLKGLQEPFQLIRVVTAGSFLQCLSR